ncbi:MAG TPA: CsbD family protein [Anaerolineae bacterium]
MNWDIIEGKWKQVKGEVQTQWGKLTSDELDQINGQREQLVGKLQESYGYTRDEAERQVNDFFEKRNFS